MKIGDRVKLSREGIRANIHPDSRERLGTVTSLTGGMKDSKTYVGVLRDGSKSSIRYWIGFWEIALTKSQEVKR
jgi:hypothetical protein